jgi:hypothetical protein
MEYKVSVFTGVSFKLAMQLTALFHSINGHFVYFWHYVSIQ